MGRKDFLGLSISELGVGTYMVVGRSENTNPFLTYRPNILIQLFTTAWRVLKVGLPLPYTWKGLTEGPFSSEAHIGGRGVGKGEETVSPFIRWRGVSRLGIF
jgi:hypothetical protein